MSARGYIDVGPGAWSSPNVRIVSRQLVEVRGFEKVPFLRSSYRCFESVLTMLIARGDVEVVGTYVRVLRREPPYELQQVGDEVYESWYRPVDPCTWETVNARFVEALLQVTA